MELEVVSTAEINFFILLNEVLETDIQHEHDYYQNKIESVEISKSPKTNPFYHRDTPKFF
jgi:hypothetical protein